VQKRWKEATLVNRYTTQVLGIDCYANGFRNDCAAPTCCHNRDEDIARKSLKTLQLFKLLRAYEAPPRPLKAVGDYIVDPEYGDPTIGEFRVKQLASVRSGPNCALSILSEVLNGLNWPPVGRPAEALGKDRTQQRRTLVEGVVAGPMQTSRIVEYLSRPSLPIQVRQV
jgi:hypothetical protein